ncbi:MAG: hypothetical protein ACTSWZ_05875 [Candidatus Heimdallarchaeaceae archaeon]
MNKYDFNQKLERELKENEKVIKFINDHSENGKIAHRVYNIKSALRAYLKWRRIHLDELLSSGVNEVEFVKKFEQHKAKTLSQKSKESIARRIKQFLRYYNEDLFKAYESQKGSNLYFSNDKTMKRYLERDIGQSYSSQKSSNRAIYYFLEFLSNKRKSQEIITPSEFISELKDKDEYDAIDFCEESLDEFQDYIFDKLNVKKQQAWRYAYEVKRFIRARAKLLVDLAKSKKPKKRANLPSEFQNEILEEIRINGENYNEESTNSYRKVLVSREKVNKLLEVASLRESIVVRLLWESGCNPVELSELKVANFYNNGKLMLDLDTPESLPKDEVFFFAHYRAKTKYPFVLAVSGETLQFISRWMKARKKGIAGLAHEVNDESYIVSYSKYPYNQISNQSISKILDRLNNLVDFSEEERIMPRNFRDTFNAKIRNYLTVPSNFPKSLEKTLKDLLLGHNRGLEANYDGLVEGISVKQILYDSYKQLFSEHIDLDNESAKIKDIKQKQEEQIIKLRKELKEMYNQLQSANDGILMLYQLVDTSDIKTPKLDSERKARLTSALEKVLKRQDSQQ